MEIEKIFERLQEIDDELTALREERERLNRLKYNMPVVYVSKNKPKSLLKVI